MKRFVCFIFLSLPFYTFGQATEENSPNFPKVISVHSEILDQERKYRIQLPNTFDLVSDEHTYPVFFLLEDEFFQMTSGVIHHLGSVERMPETIIISVLDEPVTPIVYTNNSNFWPMKQLPGNNPDAFVQHLQDELIPLLKSQYRANDFSIVMGLSYTSIFTLHSLVSIPSLFDAHIGIASGDILGMGYSEGNSFAGEILKILKTDPERKGFLYLTSADADGAGNAPEIQENLIRLDESLEALSPSNFKYVSKVFPNEGHYDVALPGLIEALELIFPKEKWFAKYREIIKAPGNAMKNLDDYYQDLSKEYGFKILPRAYRWNSVNRLGFIGPFLMRENKYNEAIEVMERWVLYQPKDVDALINLSAGYQALNSKEMAKATLLKAKNLATEHHPEKLPEIEKLLMETSQK